MRPIRTPKDLGNAVRRARRDRGLSQAQLAARAGVGRPWLSELETGKRTVELGRVLAVLAALELTVTLTAETTGDTRVDLDDILRRPS